MFARSTTRSLSSIDTYVKQMFLENVCKAYHLFLSVTSFGWKISDHFCVLPQLDKLSHVQCWPQAWILKQLVYQQKWPMRVDKQYHAVLNFTLLSRSYSQGMGLLFSQWQGIGLFIISIPAGEILAQLALFRLEIGLVNCQYFILISAVSTHLKSKVFGLIWLWIYLTIYKDIFVCL